MATVERGAGCRVKVRGGVWGPATCARSTERPPTPAIAWKNVLREKLMGMSPCSQQDFKTPLYSNYRDAALPHSLWRQLLSMVRHRGWRQAPGRVRHAKGSHLVALQSGLGEGCLAARLAAAYG